MGRIAGPTRVPRSVALACTLAPLTSGCLFILGEVRNRAAGESSWWRSGPSPIAQDQCLDLSLSVDAVVDQVGTLRTKTDGPAAGGTVDPSVVTTSTR